VPNVPHIYLPEDWHRVTLGRTLRELGPRSNICADLERLLPHGLPDRKAIAKETLAGDKYSFLGRNFSTLYDENMTFNSELSAFERLDMAVHWAGTANRH
jgi:hypothetical protein